jgi:hypothetical protein
MKNAGNAGQSTASVAGAPEGTLNPIHSSWHGGGLSLRVRRARATPHPGLSSSHTAAKPQLIPLESYCLRTASC